MIGDANPRLPVPSRAPVFHVKHRGRPGVRLGARPPRAFRVARRPPRCCFWHVPLLDRLHDRREQPRRLGRRPSGPAISPSSRRSPANSSPSASAARTTPARPTMSTSVSPGASLPTATMSTSTPCMPTRSSTAIRSTWPAIPAKSSPSTSRSSRPGSSGCAISTRPIVATPAFDGQTLYVGTEAGTIVPITVTPAAPSGRFDCASRRADLVRGAASMAARSTSRPSMIACARSPLPTAANAGQ